MFADFSVFQFLIYAAGIGFAAAIIYTNIQRTALSRFMLYLIDNNCFNPECSCTLNDIGLKGIYKAIVKSAVKSQHGFKRCVSCINESTETHESGAEVFFEKRDNTRYYLKNCDTEEIRKKYTFKTMPAKLVVLFIIALCVIVVICSFLTDMLIENITTPKLENIEENKTEQGEIQQNDNENETEIKENEMSDSHISEVETDGPRIPI